MSDKIDISGLDKVELLKKLWTNIKPASFFSFHPNVSVPSFNEDAAKSAVKNYIDYFQGRAIKMDLSVDKISPGLYDRDAGIGTFQRVVDSMQKD